MTNEELLQDLKQFVTATVRAEVTSSTQALRDEAQQTRDELGKRIGAVDRKVDAGFEAMGESVEELGALIDADKAENRRRLDDHGKEVAEYGRRIQRLERRTA